MVTTKIFGGKKYSQSKYGYTSKKAANTNARYFRRNEIYVRVVKIGNKYWLYFRRH